MTKINGGKITVDFLESQGVDRLFCVPGESFLPILDALQDSPIETVVARHEGGAAMMAEADAKLTKKVGVVLVTRGPGACNASAGIHIAQQDSTPLVMLIGQVARDMIGRDAFQEVDFTKMFGGMAKKVEEITDINRLPDALSEAFAVALGGALAGRPGPVVLSLPEDMLYDLAPPPETIPVIKASHPLPLPQDIERVKAILASAKRPILIAGGSAWDSGSIATLQDFAARYAVPLVCSFRRQSLSPPSGYYAGDLGLGCNPKLIERIKSSDAVILLGGRLSEIASQSYSLLNIPKPQMPLVHIHVDAAELGRVYDAEVKINTAPQHFLHAMLEDAPAPKSAPLPENQDYRDWTDTAPALAGGVNMAEIMMWLREYLPPEAIMTNGAGNYATWLHRYYHFRHPQSQLAPTSGSMGYGIPAAVAAKARFPMRPVLAFAGDGCFQMSMQELATAKQIGANIIVLVIDNGILGTIRMHQNMRFPNRTQYTDLVNPDFIGLGQAMGFHTEKIAKTGDFAAAFVRCMEAGKPSLIHIPI